MDDTICHCGICCKQNLKSEMHSQRTNVYPYKRIILVCPKFKENQDKRDALKAAKRDIKKSPLSDYCFKW